jgi:protoheme IX farnesyltransferase
MTVSTETSDLLEPTATTDEATPSRFADYYELTKPRLNFLVLVTTFVGAYIAARFRGHSMFDWSIAAAIIFTAMTAASAGTLNQAIERDLDMRMRRTRNRPVASGRTSRYEATAFGVTLGLCGLGGLAIFVNLLTAVFGLITIATYLFIYTPLKTRSPLNTLVGAITGALPPAMGVTAVTGSITPLAAALFALLFVWQMPHFFGLALMYRDDYAEGGFRMLPGEIDGDRRTRVQALLFATALVPISLLPLMPSVSHAGWIYGILAVVLGFVFVRAAVRCAQRQPGSDRKMFFASIIYLPLVLFALVVDQ